MNLGSEGMRRSQKHIIHHSQPVDLPQTVGGKRVLGVGTRGKEPCANCRAPEGQREEHAHSFLEPSRLGDVARLGSSDPTVMEDQEPQHFAIPVEHPDEDK